MFYPFYSNHFSITFFDFSFDTFFHHQHPLNHGYYFFSHINVVQRDFRPSQTGQGMFGKGLRLLEPVYMLEEVKETVSLLHGLVEANALSKEREIIKYEKCF